MARKLADVQLVAREDGVELSVKVVPGASQTRVAGVWGTALKIQVAAPPEGGKANAAVSEVIAELLGVRRASVTLVAGHTAALKRYHIAGLAVSAARARLGDV